MNKMSLRRLSLVFLAAVGVDGIAQESTGDAAGQAGSAAETSGQDDAGDVVGGNLDTCFNSRGMIDFAVLDDQHMYVRTRGSNYYLLTMEYCENLERSFMHRTASLIPYGREVCLNDGSYVVYENAGRQEVCPIRMIERVANRRQAREIAAGNPPITVLEELPTEVEDISEGQGELPEE